MKDKERRLIVARGLGDLPGGVAPAVATIGVFDGVHRGHQALVRMTVERAVEHGATPVCVTFDPHPQAVVAPGTEPAALMSFEERATALGEAGIAVVAVLDFDERLRRLPADAFVREVLVEGLGCVHVVAGSTFRFGHQQAGTIEALNDLGAAHGFGVTIVTLVTNGEPVSSTRIRRLLAAGDVEGAAADLGRPYRLPGIVERGAGRGKGLGIPTANLRPDPKRQVPGIGVYAGWAHRGGERHPAVINVGINPTFGERDAPIVEAHLLDLDADLYGRELAIEFTNRLRDEVRFPDASSLVAQIREDITRGRALLGL